MIGTFTKEEKQGLIGTVIVHLILLFIFLFFGLTKLIPPPDTGINLNFGTTDQGMGDVQPEVSNVSQPEPTPEPNPTPETSTAATPVKESVMTQNTQETVKVEPTPEEIEAAKQKKLEEERIKKEEEAKKRAQSLWNKVDQNKQSGNEGKTGQPGDQGSPDGNKDPGAYSGLPGTGGTAVGLGGSGRTWNEVVPQGVQNEQGKVEVLVLVDAKGNVTKAQIHTSTNTALNSNAVNAAKKWKFSEQPKLGSDLQKIIIPFVFTF